MERLRTRWAALVVALLLIVAVAGVAGATYFAQPSAVGAPHVQTAPAAKGEDGAQGEHGALVSAAAHDKDCVGGKNDNHGGAVSQVARGEVTVCDGATTAAKTKGGKSAGHRKDADHRP